MTLPDSQPPLVPLTRFSRLESWPLGTWLLVDLDAPLTTSIGNLMQLGAIVFKLQYLIFDLNRQPWDCIPHPLCLGVQVVVSGSMRNVD